MYLNNVTLTGFLGGDADTNDQEQYELYRLLIGDQEFLEGSRHRRMGLAN
jgi:hypothetical protein